MNDSGAGATECCISELREAIAKTVNLANGGWVSSDGEDPICDCTGECSDYTGCYCNQIPCPDDDCNQVRGCLSECECQAVKDTGECGV